MLPLPPSPVMDTEIRTTWPRVERGRPSLGFTFSCIPMSGPALTAPRERWLLLLPDFRNSQVGACCTQGISEAEITISSPVTSKAISCFF